MQRFMSLDFAFHTMLMHLGGNTRIVKVVNDSRLLIRIFTMGREAYDISQLEELYNQHDQIIRAVASGDPDVAAKTVSEHIQISQQERLVAFESWEREALLRKNIPAFFQVWKPRQAGKPVYPMPMKAVLSMGIGWNADGLRRRKLVLIEEVGLRIVELIAAAQP